MTAVLHSIAALLAVAIICGSILYGCSNASNNYNALANACIQSGGSWVPKGGEGYSAVCIGAHK